MAESKGCSPIIGGMAAILALVVGIAAGGGGVWYYMQEMAPEKPAVVEPAEQNEASSTNEPERRYGVLYPLEQTLRIEGSLPEKEVKEKILGERFKLRKCYQEALDDNPDLRGEMSLQFTVAGSNGAVIAALERHTDFSDARVTKCLLDEIKSWKFSKQKGQSGVKFDVLMLSMSAAEARQ